MEVAIIIVCGLPGSGKTTFCNSLLCSTVFSDYKIFHICFDDFMDHNRERDSNTSWKRQRSDVLEYVSRLITKLKEKNMGSNTVSDDNDTPWSLFSRKIGFSESSVVDAKNFLILLDDNMYYHSMRLRYYNLALEKTSLRRNTTRELYNVPKDIIIRMNEKFEEPDPLSRSWERDSLTIDSQDLPSLDVLEKIKEFFRLIISRPLPDNNIQELVEEKLKSKYIYDNNKAHQFDIIFRRAINEIVREKRNLGCNDTSMVWRNLAKCKKLLMGSVLETESLSVKKAKILLLEMANSACQI